MIEEFASKNELSYSHVRTRINDLHRKRIENERKARLGLGLNDTTIPIKLFKLFHDILCCVPMAYFFTHESWSQIFLDFPFICQQCFHCLFHMPFLRGTNRAWYSANQ